MDNEKDYTTRLQGIALSLKDYKSTWLPWSESKHALIVELKDGATFLLSYDAWNHGKEARIEVKGHYPKYGKTGGRQTEYSPGQNAPSITCSASRSIESIARDIEARFLPYYRPLWFSMKEKATAATEQINAAHALIQELTGKEDTNDNSRAENYFTIGTGSGKLQTSDGEDVTFERLHCNADDARKIMAIFKPEVINPCETCGKEIDLKGQNQTFIPLVCEACFFAANRKPEPEAIREPDVTDLKMIAHMVQFSQEIFNGFKWAWCRNGDNEMHGGFDSKLDAAKDAFKTFIGEVNDYRTGKKELER